MCGVFGFGLWRIGMTREAPRQNRVTHGAVVVFTLLTVGGFVLLFLLLANTEKQGLLVALPVVGAVVLARMILERRRLAFVQIAVPVATGGAMLAVSLFLSVYPQTTPVDQVIGGGVLQDTYGVDESEIDDLPLYERVLYCSDGRCLVEHGQMKVNDITGANQRNVLKNIVDITVIWPDGEPRTVLSKDANDSNPGALTYRFNRHGLNEALMPGVYTFVIKRVDGSELRLYSEHEGEIIELPRDVDFSRKGDFLRVTWKQSLPEGDVTWYRVGISPMDVNPKTGPVFEDNPALIYYKELTWANHVGVGEENVLEIDNPGFVDGESYQFVFYAQHKTEFMTDIRTFIW